MRPSRIMTNRVDFARITQEILDSYGWLERELAAELGITQGSVNQLKRGMIRDPIYPIGATLLELHSRRPRGSGARKRRKR
jgi:transcriptional regulator with XRE-family HTH domain